MNAEDSWLRESFSEVICVEANHFLLFLLRLQSIVSEKHMLREDGLLAEQGGWVMKGIVAYDSVHGNTKQVAEAIAEQIRSDGHQAELVALRDGSVGAVAGDFMLIGSPTRAGRMTREAEEFLKSLDVGYWKARPIVTFDTVGPLSKDVEKRNKWLRMIESGSSNAASRMQELCRERGMSGCTKVMHFAVIGFWGPLAPDALDMARDFTRQFMATMK
jgi:flavodoxin